MDFNYTLKYRTFDSLLEDVKLDLRNLSADTSIEPAQLIKVARRVNYDLGLRINKTEEVVLEVCDGKAKLPENFQVLNFALVCGEYTITEIPPQGTNIQEYAPDYTPWPDALGPCGDVVSEKTCLTKCNQEYVLCQHINSSVRTYKMFAPIVFKSSNLVSTDCPNIGWLARDEAYIKDGWVYTSLTEANLYINYQGDLTDSEGNLLVLDHPMINEYYEYALKKRIFENLIMDNVNMAAQLQIVNSELRTARIAAWNIVNTPNFSEIAKVWAMNRKAMYGKYYNMFKSYPRNPDFRISNHI